MKLSHESIDIGLLAVMLLVILYPSPARALTIRFDYTYDTTGFFTGNQAAIDALERAAQTFEPFTDGLDAIVPSGNNTWSAIFANPADGTETNLTNPLIAPSTLVIYVGARNLNGNSLGSGGPGGWSGGGNSSWLNTLWSRGEGGGTRFDVEGPAANEFGPWGGVISFDTTTSTGQTRNWHYDLNTLPTGSQNDFLSVAVHELGHVFGFGTSDSFNNLVTLAHQFRGTKVVALHGGNVPMDNDDSHWKDGTTSPNAGETAMDPNIITGTRKLFTALDYAALDDLGWQVPNDLLLPPGDETADFDGDGDIDSADFLTWQRGFGTSGGLVDGDANGDRYVNISDLSVWQSQFNTFGAAGTSTATSAIPEPSALGMTATALLILLWRRANFSLR